MKIIQPFSNPWREVKKNPAHAQLALLWSEKNNCDILAIGKRRAINDRILEGIAVLAVLIVVIGLATSKLTIHNGLYLTLGLLVVFTVTALFINRSNKNNQCYERFQWELCHLVESQLWKDISEKEPDVTVSKVTLSNECDDRMVEICQWMLTWQEAQDWDSAANCDEKLRENSKNLNSFGLGKEWKVYFAAAREKIAGNNWSI